MRFLMGFGRLFFGLALVVSVANVANAAGGSCAGLFEGKPAAANPVLALAEYPDRPFRYSELTDAALEAAFPVALAKAQARIAAIKADKHKPNFENTIEAMMRADEELDAAFDILGNYTMMVSTPERQAMKTKWSLEGQKLSHQISFDVDIFARVKAVYDRRDSLRLSREQAKILENMYRGFERNGIGLGSADKKRIQEIGERMTLLSQKFDENERNAEESTFVFVHNESRLAGLPNDLKAAAKEQAASQKQPNAWSIPATELLKVLTYAQDRALREEIWRASNMLSGPVNDNRPVVLEIIQLRQELARILGHDTYAHMATENRMAKNPATIFEFIAKLRANYLPAAEQDARELLQFALENGFANEAHGDTQLQPWDVHYYADKLKTARYRIDSAEVRPFLTLDAVHQGSLRAAEKLHDIQFIPIEKADVWDPSVRAYEVRDKKKGDLIGFFYFDPYERRGIKSSGAWNTTLRSAGEWRGQSRRPHVVNVLNISPPVGNEPSLLTMGDVRTVFHELGHGLHALLTKTRYRSLSGTSVARDFVELPSQLNEEWAMDPKTLLSFARHYKTGEAFPLDFIEKLQRAENFRVASFGLRQLFLGALDMAWHTADPSQFKVPEDVMTFEKSVEANYSVYPLSNKLISPGFGHIFAGGYAAGYYSYKWADALVADAYEHFKEAGLYNKKLARRYRAQVLSRGGTEDAGVLYERFRGQAPDPDALSRREGFAPKKDLTKK